MTKAGICTIWGMGLFRISHNYKIQSAHDYYFVVIDGKKCLTAKFPSRKILVSLLL